MLVNGKTLPLPSLGTSLL